MSSYNMRLAAISALVGLVCLLRLAASSPRILEENTRVKGFLASLPLTITVTTPVELGTRGTTQVTGRQAITVVFSRPVIALGSDFDSAIAGKQVPFRLNCGVPGKLRWVTTNIARYDPDIDWPTDLRCALKWNTNLRTFDGAKLQLGNVSASRPIASYGLYMGLISVSSKLARNLTDGHWAADVGTPHDKLPEVPPDGIVTLTFNSKVNLKLLENRLQLLEGLRSDGTLRQSPALPFTLSPCFSTWADAPSPASGAAPPPARPNLDVNDTCALIQPLNLKVDTWYTLRLRAGSVYFPLSGPLQNPLEVVFAGLRLFRIPFKYPIPNKPDESQGIITYRRLNLWLPHGLGQGTQAAALARNLQVCQLVASPTPPASRAPSRPRSAPPPSTAATCVPVAFTLTLVGKATARLSVPSLKPGETYRVYATADASVRDGFGLPLLASSAQFGMSFIYYEFVGPRISSRLAALEAAADGLQAWPYITRAPPPRDWSDSWPRTPYTRNLTSYSLDLGRDRDVLALLTYAKNWYIDRFLPVSGPPSTFVTVPSRLTTPGSGAEWEEVDLPLASSKLQLLRSCCTPLYNYYQEADSQLLLRTSLSVSVVQAARKLVAWVTDASLGGGAAVAGANVSFYGMPPYENTAPYLAASCITNSNGVCEVKGPGNQTSDRFSVVVKAPPLSSPGPAKESGPRFGLLLDAGYFTYEGAVPSYLATAVLDRRLVTPGDSIKLTGYVQAASRFGLSLPATTYAALVLPSGWDLQYPEKPPLFPVQLDGTTGALHAEVAVPATATLSSDYSLQLYLPGKPVTSPDDLTLDNLYQGNLLTYVQFTVADPRPPTAALEVDAPKWVLPNATVIINATAVSYIGASVGDSPVTFTWQVGSESFIREVLTDISGFASIKVNLSELTDKQLESLYGNLAFNIQWVGPTRDAIFKSASVMILPGPASLFLYASIDSPLPGISFAVDASLTAADTSGTIDGVPVTLTLKPDPAVNATNGPTCTTGPVATCTATSGAKWWGSSAVCRFTLPCVGRFVVEGCADVPLGGGKTWRVCSSLPLGKGPKDWAEEPLKRRLGPGFLLDKSGYLPGETPVVVLDNPFPGARLLLAWGNDFVLKTKVVPSLPVGSAAKVPLEPLGDECVGSCVLRAVVDSPRLAASALPAVLTNGQLPISRLFDPTAPHTYDIYSTISIIPTNSLSVSVEVAAVGGPARTVVDASGDTLLAIEPGSLATITARVTGAGASPGPVDVTLYAVDRAFLDLAPYDLPQPQLNMVLQLQSEIGFSGPQAYRVAPGAVRAVYDKLLARLSQLDPWLPLETNVIASEYGGKPPVDTPDDEYLALFTTDITTNPGSWWNRFPLEGGSGGGVRPGTGMPPMAPSMGAPPTSSSVDDKSQGGTGNGSGGAGGGASSTSAALLRRMADFKVTPLFTSLRLGADGRARVNFTGPQNLGAYVIRAFAAAGSVAKYGSGETEIVVRRSLSLTPSAPRFVRVGDSFEAGVVVTVGSAPATVRVTLQLLNASLSPLSVVGPIVKTYTFAVGEDLQQEVRFSFSAVAIGTAVYTLIAEDLAPGGAQDGVEIETPVYGQQGDVWVATTFALSAANDSAGWQEGLQLPAAVPGSGGLALSAGVGYYPAISAAYDNLLEVERERNTSDRYAYAPTAVLWATLPAVQSYYGRLCSADQAAAVGQSFQDLALLTDADLGLLWTDPARWGGWKPDRVDVFLNSWAAYLVDYHATTLQPRRVGAPPPPLPPALQPFAANWTALRTDLAGTWRDALTKQLIADALQARKYNSSYSDLYTLAWVRLTLGGLWTPPRSLPPLVQADLSLTRLRIAARKSSRQVRTLLSLALQPLGAANPDPQLVADTISEVTSAIRVQGRTAYVAVEQGSPSASSLADQALTLLLLVRSGASHSLIPKLAAYVASPAAGSPYAAYLSYSASYVDQALAIQALSEYDRRRGSSNPDLDLKAVVNGLTLLQASFEGNHTGPVSSTTAWQDIPPAPTGGISKLDFLVTGSGEATVTASLHFTPSVLPAFPTYRGIYVEATLQLVDKRTGRPTGRPLAAVPLGSLVALTVQITTPDDLGASTLSVLMPGGLEPLDPNVVGSENAGSSCPYNTWLGGGFFGGYLQERWGWFWPICPFQETRPTRVTYSYAALRAGSSSVVIKAVAATVGTFVVPPVRAWVEQQPELMGMTAAGQVRVCGDCAEPTYAPPAPVPKACPADCSGRGLCNLLTGVCLCDPGYGGPECRTVTA